MTIESRAVSVSELSNSTTGVIRQLDNGVEMILTYRDIPVAHLIHIHSSTPGRQLLDALDQLGNLDTGWIDDLREARTEDVASA